MSANEKKLVSYKDLMARRRLQEAEQRPSMPSPDSLPAPDSLPVADSLPAGGSLSPETAACPPDSLPAPVSLPAPDTPQPDLWAPFRDRRGHARLPHAYTDGLCTLLDVYEQAVYLQLYRLSHGYGKDTCKIGLDKLAQRANMGRTTTRNTLLRLQQKGVVKKKEIELGSDKEQGSIYWVSAPDSLPGAGRLSGDGSIKIKALKESSKKDAHARKDYSACPDCRGTGMFYPEGFDKGVARCRHEKLTRAERVAGDE